MPKDDRNTLPEGYELEGYRIDALLGVGGFGVTYRGTELSFNRPVAIKEYLPGNIARRKGDHIQVEVKAHSEEADYQFCLDCFRQEAETLVNFRHPNIVSVLRYFEANGTAYMVMDYEPGESLDAVIFRERILDEDKLLSILLPLLDGLALIHGKGFFHRDIKPENIYIREDGSPVLIDFGAARQRLGEMSLNLSIILTPPFAPCEQYSSGGNLGPWTDIYSLGMTAYVAATGLRPPAAPERERALNEGKGDPVTPAVTMGAAGSPTFLKAIDWAIAPRERDRPQTVEDWRGALEPAQGDAAVRATTPVSRPVGARPRLATATQAQVKTERR